MARSCVFFLITMAFGCAAYPCTLAHGHFHQVTAIRGQVVGHERQLFNPRWFRQPFSVDNASLTLYQYRSDENRSPTTKIADLKRITAITADSRGKFDFGAIPKGHYFLAVFVNSTDTMGGSFDVEITDAVAPAQSIVLDVSGISPDCTGGNEFIERKR